MNDPYGLPTYFNDGLNKKYEMTSIQHPTKKGLWRIRALKYIPESYMVPEVLIGELGGYVQNYKNLSQEGNCWIHNDGMVYESAWIKEDAIVAGKAEVSGYACVDGKASVLHASKVLGCARITGESEIDGTSIVTDSINIFGKSKILGNNKLYGSMKFTNIIIEDMFINCNIDLNHYTSKKSYPGYITQEDINHLKFEWTYGVVSKIEMNIYQDIIGNGLNDKEHIKNHIKVAATFLTKEEFLQNHIAKFTKTDVKYKMLELRI